METIYLNFKRYSGTRVTGGHRSSNGWVTCWTDYVTHELTASAEDAKLPLESCSIIEDFLSRYPDKSEKDKDWGVYIDDVCNKEDLAVSELCKRLNDSQDLYQFREEKAAQPYKISALIENSRKEHQAALSEIATTRKELDKKIERLKSEYEGIMVRRLYPHLRNLIVNRQIDFRSHYAGLEYYPLDLIAISNDYDLLIESILRHNPPCSKINEVYTLLTTGKYSYFDIKTRAVSQLTPEDNDRLFHFVYEMEYKYGRSYFGVNSYGIEQSFPPKLLPGMTNLVTHLLLNSEYENYEKLVNSYSFRDCKYRFDNLLWLAYAADSKWDKVSVNVIEGKLFDSISFYDRRSWVPFLKRILRNEDAIHRLSAAHPYKGKDDKSPEDFIHRRIAEIIAEFD